jgi:mono/diheme cytochrome c family protein
MAQTGWSAVVLAAVLSFFSATLRAQDDAPSLFKAKCASCHGGDGSGNTSAGKSLKLRDLGSADVQKQTDAELTAIITNGKSPMPAYKGKVTDAQIKELVTYVRGLAKK